MTSAIHGNEVLTPSPSLPHLSGLMNSLTTNSLAPVSPSALQAAFATLAQCDRGLQVSALLAPAMRKAVYLDGHYRDALCVIFQALQENTMNGTLCDLTAQAADTVTANR